MLTVAAWVLAVCAAGALLFIATAVWATWAHLRLPQAEQPATLPPVSLLKPIKGLEESLEANLRTYFEQDYSAPIEIIFASTEVDDPGIEVARRVARDYPDVPVRFVRSDAGFGLNPKVANLAGALNAATHDLVLQSDANVRVRPDYLRLVVSELLAGDGSLLTSMVVGVGERSPGAAMENLQLTAFISPAMCIALRVAGVSCVVGKSMLFRRSELEEAGGLRLVRDILAEDFILGRRFGELDKRVILSATTVENVNRHSGIESFFGRHSRWLKMRAVIHVGGFIADLMANPVALMTAAVIVSGFDPFFALLLGAVILLKLPIDALLVRLMRGHFMPAHLLLMAPVKDVVMGVAWLYAVFSRSVSWRGTRLRFGTDSRLRHDDGALPIRVARRVFAPFRA